MQTNVFILGIGESLSGRKESGRHRLIRCLFLAASRLFGQLYPYVVMNICPAPNVDGLLYQNTAIALFEYIPPNSTTYIVHNQNQTHSSS